MHTDSGRQAHFSAGKPGCDPTADPTLPAGGADAAAGPVLDSLRSDTVIGTTSNSDSVGCCAERAGRLFQAVWMGVRRMIQRQGAALEFKSKPDFLFESTLPSLRLFASVSLYVTFFH